jgi:O-antigen/teichoic acid export membrane protein
VADLTRRVLGGGVGSLAVTVGGVAVSFLAHLVLARLLGASEYGVYAVAIAWVWILVLAAKLGLDLVAVRFIAAYAVNSEWDKVWSLAFFVIKRTLLAGVVVLACFVVVFFAAKGHIRPSMHASLLIAGLIVPVMAVNSMLQASLRGLKHPVAAEIPESLMRPVLLIAAVLLAAWIFPWESLSSIVAMWVTLGTAVAASVALAVLLRLSLAPNPGGQRYRSEEWTRMALPIWSIAALNVVLSQADLLLVGAMLDPKDAGMYAASARFATFISFGLIAANTAFAPVIAELYARGDLSALRRTARSVAWAVGAFAIAVCVGMMLLAEPLLGLFGEAFRPASTALRILAFGHLVNALCGPVGFFLTMTGHEWLAARILGASVLLNLLLNVLLIPAMGINGSALASAATMMLWNGAMLACVVRRVKVNPTLFAK